MYLLGVKTDKYYFYQGEVKQIICIRGRSNMVKFALKNLKFLFISKVHKGQYVDTNLCIKGGCKFKSNLCMKSEKFPNKSDSYIKMVAHLICVSKSVVNPICA